MVNNKRICVNGVWDNTVPCIVFDDAGVSNYAKLQKKFEKAYPHGKKGKEEWLNLCERIKKRGKKKPYDCIIGLSGGTDSSYLLHLAYEYGLRPLAVNLDNGWSSDISVKNIKKITTALNIPLETYVINYEEVKDGFLSFMRASLPWIDTPTDLAIKAVLYKIAGRENIQHILIGQDFRTEGKQPLQWTYCDNKQFLYIQKTFGKLKLKSFPLLTQLQKVLYIYVRKIRIYMPYFFLDYNKKHAQELLTEKYQWEYYGGHHHENIFSRFAFAYWLPTKFNIDKRIITLSAQVVSNEITRNEALEQLSQPPYPAEEIERDLDYVVKKLGIKRDELSNLMKSPNKFYCDYPSSLPLIRCYHKFFGWLLRLVTQNKSLTFLTLDEHIDEY